MDRTQLAAEVEKVGQSLNSLRMEALRSRFPFVAGIIRAAEEAVLVAYTMLKESDSGDL